MATIVTFRRGLGGRFAEEIEDLEPVLVPFFDATGYRPPSRKSTSTLILTNRTICAGPTATSARKSRR